MDGQDSNISPSFRSATQTIVITDAQKTADYRIGRTLSLWDVTFSHWNPTVYQAEPNPKWWLKEWNQPYHYFGCVWHKCIFLDYLQDLFFLFLSAWSYLCHPSYSKSVHFVLLRKIIFLGQHLS